MYCNYIVCVSSIETLRWACRPTSLVVSACTRTWSTITLYISSGTHYLWPHPLNFYFPLLFLFVSRYQDSFSKTHNHLCYRSYHPETLTAVSSVLLLNVHTWINVLSEFTCWCLSYLYCVFVFSEWLNLSKMMVLLCRVLQKTLSKLERVCKQVKCVKSFDKRVFVSRTVWVAWKIGPK